MELQQWSSTLTCHWLASAAWYRSNLLKTITEEAVWGASTGASEVSTPDISEESGGTRLKRWRADRDESMGAWTWCAGILCTLTCISVQGLRRLLLAS